jgi:regulator of RNase E activity RraA
MIGCDDDGVVVVPYEVAGEVALHARAVLLADMKARRARYERLA